MSAPRVTLGIATCNGEAYLAEAIESCLAQDYGDFEVLIVDDASTDSTAAVIAGYAGDPRVRVVTHDVNRHIACAYNSIVEHARGELIARIGHDDVALPDRLSRQVAVFDAHPDTGVCHGDAVTIDGAGRVVGEWRSTDLDRDALLDSLLRRHNYLIDPTTMIHRRVYEVVGGYDPAYPMCNDFDLWLRAAPHFRFRHCGPGPLIRYRRHGGNFSDESELASQVEEVGRAVEAAVERLAVSDLGPGTNTRPQALVALADALDRRALPLPATAARLRERGLDGRRRIVLTSFGYADSGGGTIVPRYVSQELARRGWDVTVFHAAVGRVEPPEPYQVREWWEDGVRLVGVFNRPHGLLDLGNPAREVDDPPITAAFADLLDRIRPDAVHFHNLHNLGAALIDEAAGRGIPSYFSTHNYWLLCPRAYLYTQELDLCHGPGDRGGDCASCVGSIDVSGYRRRLAEIRGRFARGVNRCLAVSQAMKRTLVTAGYPEEMIDVVHQAMPEDWAIWDALGRDRTPGRGGDRLTVGFFGSAFPHKGPSLLVDAAQTASADIRVVIHGEIPPAFASHLRDRDTRGCVEIRGGFSHDDLPRLLAGVDVAVIPSLWWDCAPLMVSECLAGRVPVVAARVGGIPDFVDDGVNGLLFEGRDAADLAATLDRLADEPGLLERLQAGIGPPRRFSEYVDQLEAYYRGERAAPAGEAAGDGAVTVRWQGGRESAQSLAIVNREVCAGLARSGGVDLESGSGALPAPAQVEVRHRFPPDLRPSPARLAIIQPWEFGAIPRDWVEPLKANADEIWVPSEYVRRMYLAAGIEADRVAVVPNGIDPTVFRPDGPRLRLGSDPATRLLFVGGLIWRKGPDLAVAAYQAAFAGREDVELVVKDFGAGSIYPGMDRTALREYADAGRLPRIVYIDEELTTADMAALYRACDALVHPYRGEGFGMPVLEAMACGLPVIVTAGGPTDEFCPDEAGWKVRSRVDVHAHERFEDFATDGRPYLLEPDLGHLVELLTEVDRDPGERARRGGVAATAARHLTWDHAAAGYRDRILALAERPPRHGRIPDDPIELDPGSPRLLATPALSGSDALPAMLAVWSEHAPAGARLFLLADPRTHGSEGECTERVVAAAAAAGVDLDRCADITILHHALAPGDDVRLMEAVDGYVALHPACAGFERVARDAGIPVLEPTADALTGWLGIRRLAA